MIDSKQNFKKKYIKGFYINEKQNRFGGFLSISMTEEGLEQVRQIKANADGYRNFYAFPKKGFPGQFTVVSRLEHNLSEFFKTLSEQDIRIFQKLNLLEQIQKMKDAQQDAAVDDLLRFYGINPKKV